jgi:cbb3-type cytochrome oxidase maturation protein
MGWYIISSIALGLAGLIVYIYYLRRGQFEDLEDVKYQLFRNDDE